LEDAATEVESLQAISDAEDAISDLEVAIATATDQVLIDAAEDELTDAEAKLALAQTDHDNGDYDLAIAKAEEATVTAEDALTALEA